MNPFRLSVAALVVCVFSGATTSAADWPQWRGIHRDGVWTETGIIDKFESPQIKLKWRAPIGGGYTGPTVADGRVYVTDLVTDDGEAERVLCFDWQTGTKIWSYQYDSPYGGIGYRSGPRASVLIDDGLAYSLGATGHLHCFEATEGNLVWGKDLQKQYKIRMPNWGLAASPVIEGDVLIAQIGGTNSCVVAFDKKTGDERWRALSDDACYSAPIVIDQAGRRVVVCYTGNRIVGLAPENGDLLWEFPFMWVKWPIGIATPVLHNDLLLISEAHKGTLLLRLAQEETAIEKVWNRRNGEEADEPAMHCLNSTPFIDGQHIYGADSRGVLRCLRLDTGRQVWEDRTAVPEDRFATIHLIRHGQRTWLFNEKGELIIARLTPQGYHEISRATLIETTLDGLRSRRGGVTWSHPAFAYRHVFARNDKAFVCADLSALP